MSINDITGDRVATKPASDKYREGMDRIFGPKRAADQGRNSELPRQEQFQSDSPGKELLSDESKNLLAT
jgi:hypothetical protein